MAARSPILSLAFTTGTINLGGDELRRLQMLDSRLSQELETPLLLTELFPDLAVYAGPTASSEENVQKRLDEGQTSGHRIAHTSRLMDISPILVSSLQPAKNASDGVWDLHDGPWYRNPKGSTDVSAEVVASTSSVLTGRGANLINSRASATVPISTGPPLRPQHVWTEEEDMLLVKLVQTYPFHWQLIADSLGSAVISVPMDKPSAYDCWERWYWQFGEGKGKPRSEASATQTDMSAAPPTLAPGSNSPTSTPAPGTAVPALTSTTGSTSRHGQTPQQNPMLPNYALTQTSAPTQTSSTSGEATYDGHGPPPSSLSKREAKQANKHKYEGTRKSVRHQVLYDSVRRLVRRREATKQKTSGKSAVLESLMRHQLTRSQSRISQSESSKSTTVIRATSWVKLALHSSLLRQSINETCGTVWNDKAD